LRRYTLKELGDGQFRITTKVIAVIDKHPKWLIELHLEPLGSETPEFPALAG